MQKQVTGGEEYGELPTPTKAGYTFAGWSRNKVGNIDDDNYSTYHYNNRTSSEIKNNGNFGGLSNQNYYRIYGNSSNSNIDTEWIIYGKNIVPVIGGKKYVLSFYVRSEKSIVNQYIGKYNDEHSGKTYITWRDGTKTYLHENKEFNNDGNWYLITEEFTAPDNATTAQVTIGNDIPNIYGEGSYIDIGGIQFSEGSSVNEMYITPSTKVIEGENHTLYAKWR